jgi:hypothetical protein
VEHAIGQKVRTVPQCSLRRSLKALPRDTPPCCCASAAAAAVDAGAGGAGDAQPRPRGPRAKQAEQLQGCSRGCQEGRRRRRVAAQHRRAAAHRWSRNAAQRQPAAAGRCGGGGAETGEPGGNARTTLCWRRGSQTWRRWSHAHVTGARTAGLCTEERVLVRDLRARVGTPASCMTRLFY